MFPRLLPRLSAILFACAALSTSAHAEAPITVTDQKGRSIEIELIALANQNVTFRRQGVAKEFTLPLNQFDTASQELMLKKAKQLPMVMPKILPEVIIGKRGHKRDNSWYMMKQEISCSVKLTNLSTAASVPPIKGKILFIGQNTRTPEFRIILSRQNFEASMMPAETVTRELEGFATSYDGENKGYGNVGGYQYFGYILMLTDAAGTTFLDQTTTGSLRQALALRPELLQELAKLPRGKVLTSKLEVAPNASNLQPFQ